MPWIVKVQVVYFEEFAHRAKGAADRSGFTRKSPIFVMRPSLQNVPSFGRELEAAHLVTLGWVL